MLVIMGIIRVKARTVGLRPDIERLALAPQNNAAAKPAGASVLDFIGIDGRYLAPA